MRTIPGDGEGDERFYQGMIAHLDASVGHILDQLTALGLAENTLVIFSSDNGPTWPGSTGGWRGVKGTLYEGGIRVPFIAAWPSHVKDGSRSDSCALSTDLLPPFCEIAGVSLPGGFKADGQSLVPLVLSKAGLAERGTAFWKLDEYANFQTEHGERRPFATEAARRDSWKLLARDGVPLELFDLSRDPQEKVSILEANREKAEALAAQLRTWLSEPRGNPVGK